MSILLFHCCFHHSCHPCSTPIPSQPWKSIIQLHYTVLAPSPFHCHHPNPSPKFTVTTTTDERTIWVHWWCPFSPVGFNQWLHPSTPLSLLPPQQPHNHPQSMPLPAQSVPFPTITGFCVLVRDSDSTVFFNVIFSNSNTTAAQHIFFTTFVWHFCGWNLDYLVSFGLLMFKLLLSWIKISN